MKAAWERHVLSLPGPLFMADAPSHLHTSPLLSVTLRCPVSILVPGAGGEASPCSAHHTTRAPLGVPWGLGAPGSEGNDWLRAQRAGRRSHGGRAPLRPWETGSWGRRSGIWSPAEPLSQCKEASVNQLIFIEPESREHEVERTRTT